MVDEMRKTKMCIAPFCKNNIVNVILEKYRDTWEREVRHDPEKTVMHFFD